MSNESIESNSDSTAPHLTRRENSPDHSIRADGPVAKGGDATIHDRTGLYIAIIALLVAGMGLGFEISRTMYESSLRLVEASNRAEAREREIQIIDAKIQAGAAQAEATAREARTTAKMTEDKLVELRDHLNSKGMNIPKLDGH